MKTPTTPTPAPSAADSVPKCPNCGAALARDQRYCLNCGHRLTEPRVDFHHALGLSHEQPPTPPRERSWDQRIGLITLVAIAAVVVALGVGIVIGRGKGGSNTAQKPTIVTVAGGTTPSPTGSTAAAGSSPGQPVASITEDWRGSKSGWTVELSSLDKSTAQASDVNAAKTAASSKGAKGVGVLDGDAHSGTPTGKYVIYAGDFSSKKAADAEQAKLKKSFPGALVLHVQPKGAGSGSSGGSGAGSQGLNQAAAEQHLSGTAYEKASAKLPSSIGTGGAPPPKDDKKAGGGTSATCIGC
jgi:hypothetical protein